MDETNINMQKDLLRLRQKMMGLQGLGYMTPESFGTYQQTLLQIWQEAERRRQTCVSQAATLRTQAAAAEAQAGAFSVMASIMYSVVNGFVEAGEKRVAEEAERDATKAVIPVVSAISTNESAPTGTSNTRGRKKA